MAQVYSNPARETDTYALPDVEVFYAKEGEWAYDENGERGDVTYDEDGEPLPGQNVNEAGWYYWYCQIGCLPDSEPEGPFETEEEATAEAQADAQEDA